MENPLIDPVSFTRHAAREVLKMRQAGKLTTFSGDKCNTALHLELIDREMKEGYTSFDSYADLITDVFVYRLGWLIDGCYDKEDFEHQINRYDSKFFEFGKECFDLLKKACAVPFHCFRLVHESNMSKLCKADEIEATTLKYGKENITFVEVEDGLFSVFAARSFVHDSELLPQGKWLKSASYHAPRWAEDASWQQ